MNQVIKNSLIIAYLAGVSLLLFACSDNLDIQQQYAFSVENMPVPTDIKQGETIEIRCKLKEQGTFADNHYTIRYFQFEGKGTLQLGKKGFAFVPNDSYRLPETEFRLYYTSNCKEGQSFTVYFENSFGDVKTLIFDFNNQSDKEE